MSIATAIEKIRQAGFVIEADGDHIAIEPFDELTVQQIEWLRGCKPDILNALRSETAILDAGQSGNDIAPANDDDRALIHVPDLGLSDGRRISCDMTVPRANLDKLRAVIRFTLKDNGGGGSLLGSPGKTEGELREILAEKYGRRLASIDGAEVLV
jgi:hypothetical protein